MANEPPTTPIDVAHVARLARLALSPDELATLAGDLQKILAYVAELQAVDVTNVAPLVHPTPFTAPLRADVVGPTLPREVALAGAPEQDGRSFVVPTPKGLG